VKKEALNFRTDEFEWLVKKGEIAERIRAFDWSQSPLGKPEDWPQSLRSAINVCLASKIPMYVWWGPDSINIYNDAYIPLAGKVRHPTFFGRPAREMWPEIWDTMEGFLDQIHRTGEAIQHDDLPFVLDRNGIEETSYFSFSFNPAYDENGRIQGAWAIVVETTARVIAEKNLAREIKLRELAAAKEKSIANQLRIVADFSPALIAHVDSGERYQFMNRLYQDWFGFDPLTSVGKTILEVVGPASYETAKIPIRDAVAGKHVHFENQVTLKDGTTKYVDLQFVPLGDSSSEMNGFILLGYDVTERKAAEAALRANEAKYREAQERLEFAIACAQMNPWYLDLKKNQIFSASGESPLQGYELSKSNLAEVVKVRVHPDDVEDTLKALSKSIREQKPYDHEYRQLQADGSYRWISSRAMPHYDGDGNPTSISGVWVDITEKKLIADQYRAITELTPQFVWMSDEKGAITYSNSTLLNYMGVTESATLGDRWIERLHPDDREKTMAVWRNSIASGTQYEVEFRIRAKDGIYGWFLSRALPLRDNATGRIDRWLGVSTDITTRKNAEDELKRMSGILNSIMATSTDLLYVKDRFSRLVYCNPVTPKLIGRPESELLGKTDAETLGPGKGGEEIMEADRRIMESGIGENTEEWVTWPDGRKSLFLSHKEPQLDANGEVTGLIGISRDITERQAAQDEIARALQDLIRERDIREQFVATLSHDLRTPLTSARMSANLLSRKANDPELLQKLSGRIADSIDRADDMIRDLLDANLIRVGEKLPIEVVPCDLLRIATDTLDELSSVHGDRFVLSAPKEVHGFWSESGIRRIFENLGSNAIKYGDGSPIRISLSQSNNLVTLSVHNRGPAIPPEDQVTLFDPFKRTVSAQAGKQKGWGLGLTLVKGIAEAHGGSVTVRSEPGFGTMFTVTILLDARTLKGS
jgi:PAS domain S-box-containing protein